MYLPDEVPEQARQPITFLRQWLNERPEGSKNLTNEDLWYWLRRAFIKDKE